MPDERPKAEPRNITMYPKQWEVVESYAEDKSDYNISAALRRIVDEWTAMKTQQLSMPITDDLPRQYYVERYP